MCQNFAPKLAQLLKSVKQWYGPSPLIINPQHACTVVTLCVCHSLTSTSIQSWRQFTPFKVAITNAILENIIIGSCAKHVIDLA